MWWSWRLFMLEKGSGSVPYGTVQCDQCHLWRYRRVRREESPLSVKSARKDSRDRVTCPCTAWRWLLTSSTQRLVPSHMSAAWPLHIIVELISEGGAYQYGRLGVWTVEWLCVCRIHSLAKVQSPVVLLCSMLDLSQTLFDATKFVIVLWCSYNLT